MLATGGGAAATVVAAPEGALVASSGLVVSGASVAVKWLGVMMTTNATNNAQGGYERGKEGGKGSGKSDTRTKINQVKQKIIKGLAPKSVENAHKGHGNTGKPHIHFKDGAAVNIDGTWHDKRNARKLFNKEKKFLKENEWELPKEP